MAKRQVKDPWTTARDNLSLFEEFMESDKSCVGCWIAAEVRGDPKYADFIDVVNDFFGDEDQHQHFGRSKNKHGSSHMGDGRIGRLHQSLKRDLLDAEDAALHLADTDCLYCAIEVLKEAQV